MSSTSSSSGPGPGEGGAEPSPTAFVLRDNRSLVPSRRGPADAPAPPRPTEAASSRRHGACPLVPALSLGATGGARGGAIRVRGSLPGPAVPAANAASSDGCSAEVRTLAGASPAARRSCPASRRDAATWGTGRRAACRRAAGRLGRPAGPPGGALPLQAWGGVHRGRRRQVTPGEVAGLSQGRPAHSAPVVG